MVYLGGLLGLALLALWVFCVIDVLLTPESEVRNLPKITWVFLVLIFSDIGSVAWLIAGRPWESTGSGLLPLDRGRSPGGSGAASRFPEYDEPGRFAATNPDDDAEFLARVRERAETQRRDEARRRREREQAERAAREQRQQDRGDRVDPGDGGR